MAVQAQYPSNGLPRLLPSDFGLVNQQQLLQQPMQPQPLFGVIGDVAGDLHVLNNGTSAFSEQQGSELTSNNNNNNINCNNICGSRKRARECVPVIGNTTTLPLQKRFIHDVTGHDSNRLIQSTMTSTSGRLCDIFNQQNIDLDSLLSLEYERMKAALMETTRRNYRNLLQILGQNFQKRMNEKESELQNAVRRNAEIEQKVKQLAEETQIWYTLAKNNESIISDLRSNLEHALLRNKEGYGDTAEDFVADDAQSSCFDNADAIRERTRTGVGMCKVCGSADAHMLLLPCRHLCLCAQCEAVVDTCPICYGVKNAGVPILLG